MIIIVTSIILPTIKGGGRKGVGIFRKMMAVTMEVTELGRLRRLITLIRLIGLKRIN